MEAGMARTYIRRSLIAIAAVFLAVVFWGCGKPEITEGTRFTLVYSNDSHGKLEGCGCKRNGGGILKRAHRIKSLREADGSMLYCDAGNFLFGSHEADTTEGRISIAVHNELGTSVVNISEEDLERGLETFEQRRQEARFDFVSTNITADGKALAPPYVMKRVKGLDIAFVGLCASTSVMRRDSTKLPPGVRVENPMVAARQVIPRLAQKADLLVILSTCGDAIDSALAETFTMIDVIIGGRTYRSNAANPWKVGNAVIVRAQRQGRTLGRLEFEFAHDRQIKSCVAFEEAMETDAPSDEAMLAVVRKFLPDFVDSAEEGTRSGSDAASAPEVKER
jgi:2',3'-cyclic-nucleotide 2'-phosphodiesterase (5'-nucleotidase family)